MLAKVVAVLRASLIAQGEARIRGPQSQAPPAPPSPHRECRMGTGAHSIGALSAHPHVRALLRSPPSAHPPSRGASHMYVEECETQPVQPPRPSTFRSSA